MLVPSEARRHLRIGTPAEMADARTRSHLPDGRVVGWYGASGHVVDAELSAATPPPALVTRHGAEDFWERWTASECQAKLASVPITLWLRRHPLGRGPAQVVTDTDCFPGVTLSLGCAPRPD